jgi:DNA ligase-associated metallophosphoesterase
MFVTLNQIEVCLLGDRGVHWHAQRMLLVADPHLGKEATFRASGLAVPSGSTEGTLAAIGRMIEQTDAMKLVILGDLFHARSSLARDVTKLFTLFLDRYKHVAVSLVKGNHDVSTGPLASDWSLQVVDPPWDVDGVTLLHFPDWPTERASLSMAGHLHPATRISDGIGTTGKLPCFYWDAERSCLVLPAIGEFTGTATVQLGASDRAWVSADGEVIEVTTAQRRRNKTVR